MKSITNEPDKTTIVSIASIKSNEENLNPSQKAQILSYLDKSCELFDSYIAFNEQLKNKFKGLKVLAQEVKSNLAKQSLTVESNMDNANDNSNLNNESFKSKINSSSLLVEVTQNNSIQEEPNSNLNQEFISPSIIRQSIIELDKMDLENIQKDQIEKEQQEKNEEPMLAEIESTTTTTNEEDPIKVAKKKLFEFIESNPLNDDLMDNEQNNIQEQMNVFECLHEEINSKENEIYSETISNKENDIQIETNKTKSSTIENHQTKINLKVSPYKKSSISILPLINKSKSELKSDTKSAESKISADNQEHLNKTDEILSDFISNSNQDYQLDNLTNEPPSQSLSDTTRATCDTINDSTTSESFKNSSHQIKNCSILLDKLQIANNFKSIKISNLSQIGLNQQQLNSTTKTKEILKDNNVATESQKEDEEIDRLCRINKLNNSKSNIVNSNSKLVLKDVNSTRNTKNKKINLDDFNKENEPELTEDESSDSDENNIFNSKNDKNNLSFNQLKDENLLSLGLVPRDSLKKGEDLSCSSSFDDSDSDLNINLKSLKSKLKKEQPLSSDKKSDHKPFMPELIMNLNSSSSDNEETKPKEKSNKNENQKKITRNSSRVQSNEGTSKSFLDEDENVNDKTIIDKCNNKSDEEPDSIQDVTIMESKDEKMPNSGESSKESKNEKFIKLEKEESDESDNENLKMPNRRRKKVLHSSESNEDATNSDSTKFDSGRTSKKKKRISFKSSGSEETIEDDDDGDDKKPRTSRRKPPKRVKIKSEDDDDENSNEKDEDNSSDESSSSERSNDSDDSDIIEVDKVKKAETSLVEIEPEAADLQKIYLDFDEESKKPLLEIDPHIVKHLKPHQIEGIRFMWDSCFEKVEMIQKGHKGSGCLLAHCMGLGKTLQIVTLVHTVLTNSHLTKVNRVLILLPINVLINWRQEFQKWTSGCKKHIRVYDLPNEKADTKDLMRTRLSELQKWYDHGGVFLIGYTIFARLVQGQNVKPKKLVSKFENFLLNPGADLVICDEGHVLKSEKTSIAKSVYQVDTQRRIVLTGTPLQNNLIEYHCMVSFVKPNLLGTTKEFKNRFVNPIYNGQHKDSTEADVRYMKKRAHVLHNVLDGCVQRKDYAVISNLLPPKNEYVLSIRLSEKQIELYRAYLVKFRGIDNVSNLGKLGGAQLFSDFQVLSRVWTHPWNLKLNEKNEDLKAQKIEDKLFIQDVSDTEIEKIVDDELDDDLNLDSDIFEICREKTRNPTSRRSEINGGGINNTKNNEESNQAQPDPVVQKWWSDLVTHDCENNLELSGKLVVLFNIINLCGEKGDKLLVFSQSLLSLDIIEKFLNNITMAKKGIWKRDVDYFRMDGQTDIKKRKSHIANFNDPKNKRSRLFLISTKAGGIGINLVGANRCIIFDACWNPSYDTQSIFRIYRFGQTKEVFVYRFLSQGTMEEKIYQRQVTKQSLSQRVIDEHQLDRHFTSQELRELYAFEPDIWNGSGDVPILPNDDLLKNLLLDCKKWIVRYHEHDSLLENKVDEVLSEEDRKLAWAEYEAEKTNNNGARFANVAAGGVFLPDIENDIESLDSNKMDFLNQMNLFNFTNHLSSNPFGSNQNFISSLFDSNNLNPQQMQAMNFKKDQYENQMRKLEQQNKQMKQGYNSFRENLLDATNPNQTPKTTQNLLTRISQTNSADRPDPNNRFSNKNPSQQNGSLNNNSHNVNNSNNNSGANDPLKDALLKLKNMAKTNPNLPNYNPNLTRVNSPNSNVRVNSTPGLNSDNLSNKQASNNQSIAMSSASNYPQLNSIISNQTLDEMNSINKSLYDGLNFSPNMNAAQLMEKHRRQINHQTYNPTLQQSKQKQFSNQNSLSANLASDNVNIPETLISLDI